MAQPQAAWVSMVAAGAVLVALACAPAFGFELSGRAMGDGSGTSNADHLVPGACPECAVLYPPDAFNPLDTSLSLGLRGSYTAGPLGARYKAIALPEASAGFAGSRQSWLVRAGAELSVDRDGQAGLDFASARLEGSYRLDEATGLSGALALETGRSGATTDWPNVNVAIPAQPLAGSGEASLSRDVGPFTFTARGSASRMVYGPEILADLSVVDVGHRNTSGLGAGLRASYAVGPIVSVFADLSAARQLFDAPSPFLGVRQDNDTYTASVGVHADWGEVASVAAEVGATTRQFADPGLAPATGALLRASASWRPTETLTLGAAASYGIGAETADSGETTPIEARLSGSAAYVVNPWLTLRGSAGWSHVQKVGAAGAETRYDLGLGADYLINPMARLSADYAYSHRQREPDPPEYEHRASVGVTFSR